MSLTLVGPLQLPPMADAARLEQVVAESGLDGGFLEWAPDKPVAVAAADVFGEPSVPHPSTVVQSEIRRYDTVVR